MSAPAEPIEGAVWIRTGETYAATINALSDDNSILLNLSEVQQYTDGAWVSRIGWIYQNGTWIEITSILMLYNYGNQYADVTGGWTPVNASAGSGGGSAALENTYMYVWYYGSGGRDSSLYTKKKIDATKYKKLCALVNVASAGNGVYLGLASATGYAPALSGYYVASTKTTSNGEMTLRADISAITGSYYAAIYGDVGKAYVYKVWME